MVWVILMNELVTILGISLLSLLNRLETISQGNIFMVALCVFYEIHVTRGGWWVEDMVYGDMNQNYGFNKGFKNIINDNFGTYLPYMISFPVLFTL